MKKVLLLSFYLISCLTLQAQDVKISKHFFTNENWRLAVGLNYDVALANKTGESSFIKYIDSNIPESVSKFGNSSSIGFNVDIYSANSVLGFYTLVNSNTNRIILNDALTNRKDSITLNFLEVPLYIKLRFGKTNGHTQTWLALGGGYALTKESTIKTFDSNDNLLFIINNKDIANSVPFVSTILGYELVFGNKDDFQQKDNYRFLLYAKLNYDLGNRLNTSYAFDNGTVIKNYNNTNMQFMKVSFGVSLLMRINAFVRLLEQLSTLK